MSYLKGIVFQLLTNWNQEAEKMNRFLEVLEAEEKKIQNPDARENFRRRRLFLEKYGAHQRDVFARLLQELQRRPEVADLERERERNKVFAKYIKSLGGDPITPNWLTLKDFHQ